MDVSELKLPVCQTCGAMCTKYEKARVAAGIGEDIRFSCGARPMKKLIAVLMLLAMLTSCAHQGYYRSRQFNELSSGVYRCHGGKR